MNNFERLKKLFALFLLFLLLAVPLSTLQRKFEQIYYFSKTWFEAESENLLRDEMSEFKNDFKSESFLSRFFQLQLPASWLSDEIIKADNEEDSKVKKQKFEKLFSKICKELTDKQLSFKPLFIILSDGSMSEVHRYFSNDFLAREKIQMVNGNLADQNFLSRFFLFFSFAGTPPESMPQNGIELMNHFVRQYHKTVEQLENQKFFYKGVLSSFVKEKPLPW